MSRADKPVVILSASLPDPSSLTTWHTDKAACPKAGCLLTTLKIDINYWYNRGMTSNMGNVESLRADAAAES